MIIEDSDALKKVTESLVRISAALHNVKATYNNKHFIRIFL